MKKALFSVVLSSFCFSAVHGANLVVENFDTDGLLAGSTPTTGVNWNAYTQYSKVGGVLTRTSGTGAIGAGVALGGTLASGVYDLTSTINFTANATPSTGVWGIGFSQTTDVLTVTTTAGGSPWIFMRENGEIAFRATPIDNTTGTTIIARAAASTQPGGSYTIRLSLDTTAALWTVNAYLSINGGAETQLDLNGGAAGSTHTYTTNPTIGYAGITSTAPAGVGSLDNFLLTGPPVIPEPSSALLSLLGVLGLTTLRNRRN